VTDLKYLGILSLNLRSSAIIAFPEGRIVQGRGSEMSNTSAHQTKDSLPCNICFGKEIHVSGDSGIFLLLRQ
jgi:hypothetical protein